MNFEDHFYELAQAYALYSRPRREKPDPGETPKSGSRGSCPSWEPFEPELRKQLARVYQLRHLWAV